MSLSSSDPYRPVPPFERLDPAAILAAAGSTPVPLSVEVLATCDSTNAVLSDRAAVPHAHVLVAEEQTAGRGRRGRQWVAVPGGSLAFSLLWRFSPGSPMPLGLSLVVGVGLMRGLSALGVPQARLKWPNDVMVDGHKLAGVLVELQKGPVAIIGVGLNLWLPAEVRDAIGQPVTTLADQLTPLPARNRVLGALLAGMASALQTYDRKGFLALKDEWLAAHAFQGQPVVVLEEGREPVAGRCAGVDVDGALLLVEGSRVQRVVSGDVSLRLA